MTKTTQVKLTIHSDRLDEFIRIINEDKETALQSPYTLTFDIIQENNKFIINQSYSSDNYILNHHKQSHYRWTNFAKSGGILNIEHQFI